MTEALQLWRSFSPIKHEWTRGPDRSSRSSTTTQMWNGLMGSPERRRAGCWSRRRRWRSRSPVRRVKKKEWCKCQSICSNMKWQVNENTSHWITLLNDCFIEYAQASLQVLWSNSTLYWVVMVLRFCAAWVMMLLRSLCGRGIHFLLIIYVLRVVIFFLKTWVFKICVFLQCIKKTFNQTATIKCYILFLIISVTCCVYLLLTYDSNLYSTSAPLHWYDSFSSNFDYTSKRTYLLSLNNKYFEYCMMSF